MAIIHAYITGEQIMSARGIFSSLFYTFLSVLVLQFPFIVYSSVAASATETGKKAVSDQKNGSFSDAVKAETHPAAPQLSPQQVSGGSAAATAPFAEIKVEKATGENACTVQEVFSRHKELAGKIIQVRGKVVKYNPGIMGKNWIHIQDGSGDPMHNTHDLVATSTEEAVVGEIVTVQGKLAADKDFGAGYTYTAIIEEAKIKK
jgi:hypothetical protein